jgi:hypothetical protein
MYGNSIRTFEELRAYIWQEKQDAADMLLDRMEECSRFQIARWKGEIDGYNNILDVLRNILKHGEDLNEFERSEEMD